RSSDLRKLAIRCESYFLQRQKSAIIIEAEHQRSANRGLQPFPMMVGGVVVPEAGMEAAHTKVEILVVSIQQFQSLQISFNQVVVEGQDDEFSQCGHML